VGDFVVSGMPPRGAQGRAGAALAEAEGARRSRSYARSLRFGEDCLGAACDSRRALWFRESDFRIGSVKQGDLERYTQLVCRDLAPSLHWHMVRIIDQ
jgi:hypothetical protein